MVVRYSVIPTFIVFLNAAETYFWLYFNALLICSRENSGLEKLSSMYFLITDTVSSFCFPASATAAFLLPR